MLQSLREETEGKVQMLLSPRKNSLDSLFKEVRVFKVSFTQVFATNYAIIVRYPCKNKHERLWRHYRYQASWDMTIIAAGPLSLSGSYSRLTPVLWDCAGIGPHF